MDTATKQLLKRWQSLRSDGGLKRAASARRWLWALGLILLLIVVFGLYYHLPSLAVATAAAAAGWVIAEHNALRSRMTQWPAISGYIDWERVSNDLDSSQEGA